VQDLTSVMLPFPRKLTQRSVLNPDLAVQDALDLVDDMLEAGGFLEACDEANAAPPDNFSSWAEWKSCTRRKAPDNILEHSKYALSRASHHLSTGHRNVTTAGICAPVDPTAPTVRELRRHAGYLRTLASNPPLQAVLSDYPYRMPSSLSTMLQTSSDLATLSRRMGSTGVHYDDAVAMDLIMMISHLRAWCWHSDLWRSQRSASAALRSFTEVGRGGT
jgi:hypothetical protein